MKFSKTTVAGLICVIVAIFALWNKNKDAPERFVKVQGSSEKSETTTRTTHAPNFSKHEQPQHQPSKDISISANETKDLILEQIHASSVTYDAKELPKIAPFLEHDDPEVRRAAMEGMIVLGDSSAGTWLRAASKTARTPHEAVAFEEAANYMELPPSKYFKLRKKESPEK